MPEQDPPDDADPAGVERDDELVEDLRAGQVPDRDALGPALAAWRDEVQRPVSGWITDPSEPSGWRWVRDLSDVEATAALPVVPAGQVRYGGAVDYLNRPRGENDHLVQPTDNRLRDDDLAFEQPPQDPDWRSW